MVQPASAALPAGNDNSVAKASAEGKSVLLTNPFMYVSQQVIKEGNFERTKGGQLAEVLLEPGVDDQKGASISTPASACSILSHLQLTAVLQLQLLQ